MYTEPSGPMFRATMDLCYNYDEEWLWGSLAEVVSDRGYAGGACHDGRRLDARELAQWLHDRRLALPPGSITVHHLDSHDTFWWGEKAQFRSEAFGPGAARAFFSVCSFIDGGLMNYTGGEKEMEDHVRRVLATRSKWPELTIGTCDYLGVDAGDPMVFGVLRRDGRNAAMPLVNLSDREAHCSIALPRALVGLGQDVPITVWDDFNGTAPESGVLERIEVTIPPYGTAVYMLRNAAALPGDRQQKDDRR
jgi:hypothetical protein